MQRHAWQLDSNSAQFVKMFSNLYICGKAACKLEGKRPTTIELPSVKRKSTRRQLLSDDDEDDDTYADTG